MTRRNLLLLTCSLAVLILSSCKGESPISAAAVSHDLKDRGVTDVIKTASEAKYTPPADGHLTGAQVENFIAIRKRAKIIEETGRRELAERAKSTSSASPSLTDMISGARGVAMVTTADLRASQELGLNSAEYEWVKQQMVDASSASIADHALSYGKKKAADERADLQQHLDGAPDEDSKKIYAGLIADSEKSEKDAAAAVEPQSEAVIYNKQLLAKYEDAARPMMELLLGGTGHEEEIQKGIAALKNYAVTPPPKAP